jgi:MFS family permease
MTGPPVAEPVKKRLRPLYATGFIHSFVLWYSIEKLFMRSVGLNDYLVTVATLVYIVVMMVANIPLGVLADRWRRKGVLYIATCALIGSSLVCGLSHGLAMYAAGISVWGLFYAAYAGTYDSAIYDVVLEETGSAEAFARCYGRVQMLEATAFITSALFSALVARYSLRLEYLLTIPFTCCAFATLRRFREPGLHRTAPRPHLMAHLGRLVHGTTRGHVGWIVVALVANCVVMRLLIEFYQLWYLGLALPVIWYGPSCALMYSGAWGGGALAGWLRGGRALLVTGLGTLMIACGMFFRDPRLVVGAQVATIFGVTVLNIVLTRYLHDAMPSTIRAGVSSVVSTIGYGVFMPTALAFGLFSRSHGIFTASVFVVVPLSVMCLAVARGRRWSLRPAVTRDRRWSLRPAVTRDRRWSLRLAERPLPVIQPGDLLPSAPVPGYGRERVAGCAPGPLIGTALGVVPGYTGPAPAYGGPKVYRVGDPAKSLESRANTHSGRSANTLFSAGSTISGP